MTFGEHVMLVCLVLMIPALLTYLPLGDSRREVVGHDRRPPFHERRHVREAFAMLTSLAIGMAIVAVGVTV